MIKTEYRNNYVLYNEYLEYLKDNNCINEDDCLDYWSNIPIKVEYLKALYRLYKPNMSLLDLGCGCGQVLRFASNIGYKVEGIEFNKDYDFFNEGFKYSNKDIKRMSAFNKWDIIYLYRPLKDKELDILINKIIESCNSGTLIFTPTYDITDDRVDRLEQYVYKKK